MNSKAERFYNFIKNEKTRIFFAFILYFIFIVACMEIHLPLVLQWICYIVSISILVFTIPIYITIWFDKKVEKNQEKTYLKK